MSVKENKAVIHRFVDDLCNKADLALTDELFDGECTVYHPAVPAPMQGAEAVKTYVAMLLGAFPDFHVVLEDLLVDGDKVVIRTSISGTFKGQFAGLAPTGKHATWTGMGIYRIAGCKIVEAWEELDLLGGFQRLGVLPAMA
jgi:predicted ester cyclase